MTGLALPAGLAGAMIEPVSIAEALTVVSSRDNGLLIVGGGLQNVFA